MTRYRASKLDCESCSLKPRCCPNAPGRKLLRSIHEGARDEFHLAAAAQNLRKLAKMILLSAPLGRHHRPPLLSPTPSKTEFFNIG